MFGSIDDIYIGWSRYQKVTCNADGTVSIDYFETYNCVGDDVDMEAALQNYVVTTQTICRCS